MKKLLPKKIVYHIGDEVEIINPLFFVRVGYPLSLTGTRKTVTDIAGKEIEELARSVRQKLGIITGPYVEPFICEDGNTDTLVDLFAREYIRSKFYGGSERSIHTVTKPDCVGKHYHVAGKRIVKTGIRVNGTSYGDEGDYDPPYLGNEKSHVILSLSPNDGLLFEDVEIEECHVKKVEIALDAG